MEVVEKYLTKIGFDEFEKVKPLKNLSEKIGIKVSLIMGILCSLLLLFVLLEWGSFIITSLVGFLYPAYMSFKAIETAETGDDTQWLTYWVVYSFFTVFNDIVIYFFGFIPFYYIFKVAFYIWMFHPRTRGAQILYNKAIKPVLLRYEGKVDSFSNMAEESAALLAERGKDIAEAGGNLAKKANVTVKNLIEKED